MYPLPFLICGVAGLGLPSAALLSASRSDTLDDDPSVVAGECDTSYAVSACDGGDIPGHCDKDTHFFSESDCDHFTSQGMCDSRRQEITWLASFQGSGNTWTRALLEDATGIYTGSHYCDQTLINEGMLGEGHFDPKDVLVVKTHARNATMLPVEGHRAIVLVRSPLDACLARIQIHFADQLGENMHSGEVPLKRLQSRWYQRRRDAISQWKEFVLFWMSVPYPVTFLKYEDLVGNTEAMLTDRVLPFLGLDSEKLKDRVSAAVAQQHDNLLRNHSYTFKFSSHDREIAQEILGDVPMMFGYEL